MSPIVELSKDFVRVAKRLAARAKRNGILPPVVAIGSGRAEVSDGYVVVSVPADHEGPTAVFDAGKLKGTHGAMVGRDGNVLQSGGIVAEVKRYKGEWPNFDPLAAPEGEPFVVEPQLLIDALDAFPKDGTVKVYLPTRAGMPVTITGADGARAILMPQQEGEK